MSICDEDLSTLHTLSNALLSREPSSEYREALSRALDIPECKVVPFFGGFLRDLRAVFMGVPSIVVLSSDENQSLEVRFVWYKLLYRDYIIKMMYYHYFSQLS